MANWQDSAVPGAAPSTVPGTTPDLTGETAKSLETRAQDWQNSAVPAMHAQHDLGIDKPWHSFVTGAGRTEFPKAPSLYDLTEIGHTKGVDYAQKFRLAAGYLVSAEPQQVADIALKTLPGSKQKNDIYGNPMISFQGKDYYVNPPGLDRTDIEQAMGQLFAFLPAGKVAAMPATLGKRMAAGYAAGGATSVGLDLASEQLGSKQGISDWRAFLAGTGGAVAEVLAPAAMRFWNAIKGKPRFFDTATGHLTDEGRRAAEAAGFDPAKMGSDLEQMYAQEATRATGGAEARVRGKEFRIPMTRGQASGDWNQIAKEEATRHGAHGATAGDIMRKFGEEQQTAMRGARAEIQSKLGGGETRLARPAQAGDIVGEGLSTRAQQARAAIEHAYNAVPGDAMISADGFKGLWRRGAESVRDMPIDPELTPASLKALKIMRDMEGVTRRQAGKSRITAANLQKIEVQRRKIGNLFDAAKNATDRKALTRIKNAFDDWYGDAVDNYLMAGSNPKTLELMKIARARNAEYRAKFGGGSGEQSSVDRTMQNIIAGDRTPEQVVNLIWGKGQLGAKDEAVQIVRRIKDISGEGSEEMLALKEAGWLKLSKEIGQDGFSPRKFRTRLNKVLEENRSLMEEIYTPEEMNMFERFRDEVMRTVPPESATNPSKTSYTMARLARDWVGRIGQMMVFSGNPVGAGVAFSMKRVPEVMGTAAAKRSLRPLPLPRARAPLFLSAGMAGGRALTPETKQQPRNVNTGQ